MRRGIRLKGIIYRRDKTGKIARIYYRAPNGLLTRLPLLPENDPRFLEAYGQAVTGGAEKKRPSRAREGSLGRLVQLYLASRTHREKAPGTRDNERRHCAKIIETQARRDAPVSGLRAKHIRNDLEPLSAAAAINRLKVWRPLMKHAKALDWIEDDPSLGIERPRYRSDGHHTWTHDEIAEFRKRWPIGTEERLAFEVLYWSGARRSDACRFGRQMIARDGWLKYVAGKNGAKVEIPTTCKLPAWVAVLEPERAAFQASIDAMPHRLTFIAKGDGTARSAKAFGNWFANAVEAAGLDPRCTAHGLRKARCARLAEIGATAHQIGAWIGDKTLAEVTRYTRDADRRKILAGTEQKRKTGTPGNPRSKKAEKT